MKTNIEGVHKEGIKMGEEMVKIDIDKVYIALNQEYGWTPFEIDEMEFDGVVYFWQITTGKSIRDLIINE